MTHSGTHSGIPPSIVPGAGAPLLAVEAALLAATATPCADCPVMLLLLLLLLMLAAILLLLSVVMLAAMNRDGYGDHADHEEEYDEEVSFKDSATTDPGYPSVPRDVLVTSGDDQYVVRWKQPRPEHGKMFKKL